MIMFTLGDLGIISVIVIIAAVLVGKLARRKSGSKSGDSGRGSNIYNDDSYWS